MWKFIARRFLQMIPVLFLVSVAIFVINELLPGDVVQAIFGEEATADKSAYDDLREELGLNDPIPVRYLRWLGDTARGDFGVSYRNGEDVFSALMTRLPRTLELAGVGMVIAFAVGLPIGILSAVRPNTKMDTGGTILAIGGVAIPDFWLGIMLIYFFAFVVKWFPGTGYVAPGEDLVKNLQLMILPGITLSTYYTASLMRLSRSSMLEVMQQDYIRTARAKGLRQRSVVMRHALKNAMIPVVTLMGLQTGRLFGGAVVTETVFNIPGMGKWAADSIFFRDFNAIQSVVLTMCVAVLLFNFVTDILYSYIDPRIRLETEEDT